MNAMIAIASLFEKLRADRKGVTALEYGVIAAALVVAVGVVFTQFGTGLGTQLTAILAKVGGV
jgi:pilus assembly protein Flp/PilA